MERPLTGDFLPLSAEWQPIFAVFSALACGACQTNLSGDLSDENPSRAEKPKRAVRCAFWIKVKNPNSPAMLRAEEGTLVTRGLPSDVYVAISGFDLSGRPAISNNDEQRTDDRNSSERPSCDQRSGRCARARRRLSDPFDHPLRQGTGMEVGSLASTWSTAASRRTSPLAP